MRAIMTGGGTGGHVNPALAIAYTIKKYEPDSEIVFVGTSRGIENKLVAKEGYELYHVEVQGLKRSLSPSNFRAAWLAYRSPVKAAKIIKDFRPDIVIGTGGYVCWPVVKAACRAGVPAVLHESNAIAGVAVRMLQNDVDRIYLNFEKTKETLKCSPDKILRVGNPLRGDFMGISKEKAREELGLDGKYKGMILSYGGSMGAEKVNDAVFALMKEFSSKHPEILHIHATGSIEWEIAKDLFREKGLDEYPNLELVEYIYDMPLKMAAADLVICRAGALTVSEISLLGKCVIFIPSPNVAENHQYKNAKVLADGDAALIFEEKDLAKSTDSFVSECASFFTEEGKERSERFSENVRKFAVPDSNDLIYKDIRKLLDEKK